MLRGCRKGCCRHEQQQKQALFGITIPQSTAVPAPSNGSAHQPLPCLNHNSIPERGGTEPVHNSNGTAVIPCPYSCCGRREKATSTATNPRSAKRQKVEAVSSLTNTQEYPPQETKTTPDSHTSCCLSCASSRTAISGWANRDNPPLGSYISTRQLSESSADYPQLSDDEYRYWLDRVRVDGWNLKEAPGYIRSNKKIVIAAVRQDGWALQHASPLMQDDHDVVLAAVKQNFGALLYASPGMRSESEVIMAAVQQDGKMLNLASPSLQDNKLVVLEAVKQDGHSIKYSSPKLRNDKEIVLVAVQKDGEALKYATPPLRNDKRVVLMAVKQDADAIKYAFGELQRDPDVLAVTGMVGQHSASRILENDDVISRPALRKKIVLSTRFALNPTSMSEATWFTRLLTHHHFVQSRNFKVYAPNAFDKKTCDPNWTDFDHPCRGTKETCRYDNVLTEEGRPTDNCCWRYSFRYQLEEAKKSGGFLLQLVEKLGGKNQELGMGQKIERDMGRHLKLKIFRVYRPMDKKDEEDGSDHAEEHPFTDRNIEVVIKAIEDWYNDDCRDMSECIVRPNPWKKNDSACWRYPTPSCRQIYRQTGDSI